MHKPNHSVLSVDSKNITVDQDGNTKLHRKIRDSRGLAAALPYLMTMHITPKAAQRMARMVNNNGETPFDLVDQTKVGRFSYNLMTTFFENIGSEALI